MTVARKFTCNLCRMEIADAQNGIGIHWATFKEAKPVYLLDSENHLCNPCVEGVRALIGHLDSLAQQHRALDLAEEAERSK